MTLPAHGGPFVLLLMTAFAVGVKSLHQRRLFTRCLQRVAIRATLVFGGFIFHQLAVFIINMVADAAFFYLGELVVCVMPEDGRRAPGIFKYTVIDQFHVLLRVGTDEKPRDKQQDCRGKENFLFHSKAIQLKPEGEIKMALYAIKKQIAT